MSDSSVCVGAILTYIPNSETYLNDTHGFKKCTLQHAAHTPVMKIVVRCAVTW